MNSAMSMRAAQPSRLQLETLLYYFESKPELATGFSKSPIHRERQRSMWMALTRKLNSMQGCKKTWQQWSKHWSDKKNFVRKKNAHINQNKKAVGGDPYVALTETDQRILNLMMSTHPITLASRTPSDKHVENNVDETHEILDASSIDPEQAAEDRLSPLMVKRESLQFVDPENPPSPAYSFPASPPSPGGAAASTAPSGKRLRRLPLSQTRPTALTAPPNRLRQKLLPMSPPSQRLSEFNRIAERFLALEEQRLEVEQQRVEVDRQRVEADQQRVEVDRMNSQTFATLVQRELERDTSAAQALLAIGEGLKLLAEALNK